MCRAKSLKPGLKAFGLMQTDPHPKSSSILNPTDEIQHLIFMAPRQCSCGTYDQAEVFPKVVSGTRNKLHDSETNKPAILQPTPAIKKPKTRDSNTFRPKKQLCGYVSKLFSITSNKMRGWA